MRHGMTPFRLVPALALLAAICLCAPAVSAPKQDAKANKDKAPKKEGKKRAEEPVIWQLEGGGWGHGIGMSQFGAKGLAEQGVGWQQILAHYYRDTWIGSIPPTSVTILLLPGVGSADFSGADTACGYRLDPGKSYNVGVGEKGLVIENYGGKRRAECGDAMTATGPGPLILGDKGTYHGSLQFRANGAGGIDVVNWVGIEEYLKGVVPDEVPVDWHPHALRAQAVAARSYAVAQSAGGANEMYDDARSQVYGGVGAETEATNSAVEDTFGLVVSYGRRKDAQVATTYFFSTSGGHTENVENVFGGEPRPYLKGVPDPTDKGSPYHRWQESYSQDQIDSVLSGLVSGSLRAVRVRTGASPRVLEATLVGTEGKTTVSGEELQSRFDLRDRWVTFHRIDPSSPRRFRAPWKPS